jgi:transmembrane sensor
VTAPIREPISDVLETKLDHGAARRIWQGVSARRLEKRRARERRNIAVAFMTGLCAAVLVLFATGLLTTAPRPREVAIEVPPAPLVPTAPIDWPAFAAPEPAARKLEFTDGSRIDLAAGGRLAQLENTGRSVVFLLKGGHADFDVRPGGPRRWSIEAGIATVEVVGTRFAVTRTRDRVVVEVEHGTVLVRGERVTDRVQRLVAGDRLVVESEELAAAAPASATSGGARQASSAPAPVNEPLRAAVAAPPPANAWRELAQEGAYAEAYRNLGAEGIAGSSKTADLEQLLALADVARLSGHPRDAVAPLERASREHADDPRAAMAAFMLGRVHLDSLQDPAAAVRAFQAALAQKLPQALREDAYLRLIEAAAKAGDRAVARAAWNAHRAEFPNSTRKPGEGPWGREP